MASPSTTSVAFPVPMQPPVAFAGTEMVQNRPWFVDERDGFISWLRGEFAASNAMIDVLLQHLSVIGDPGEYDQVASCVQSRRSLWSPVLHLQQFYPINEVVLALQQVVLAKQEDNRENFRGFEGRRGGFGQHRHGGHRYEGRKEGNSSNYRYGAARGRSGEGNGPNHYYSVALGGSSEVDGNDVEEKLSKEDGDSGYAVVAEGSVPENGETSDENRKLDISNVPQDAFAKETFNGKMVNIAEGLKLYEELLDRAEVTALISLANEMRAAGHRGELPGQTFVTTRRPTKGHGREMIQFGIPVDEGSREDNIDQASSESKVKAIPQLLEECFDKLVKLQILPIKPDYCVIDFFNEGDHSTPHMWPSWYGRPVCNFFLTDCEVVYGNGSDVVYNHLGYHSGPFKFSTSPGALLLMEGKRGDLPKRAIPSIKKHRIILTFGKYQQPKKALPSETLNSTAFPVPPHLLGRRHIGPPSYQRHPPVAKHHGAIPANGVRPLPPTRPQNVPHTMQPLFVASASVAPAGVPYSMPPTTAVWTVAGPPRHPAPSVQAPGTGVFLPQGGSNHSLSQQPQMAPLPVELNGTEQPRFSSSPKNIAGNAGVELECNGDFSSDAGGSNESQQNTVSKKLVDKQTEAVAK